ncbi:hypothetical protein FE36_09920 [Xanthomonas oryzae pv. oryzicola]|nr:hypothetical protein FE36_09920 [Xanthomonas oryzae pv. oryzicola]
MSACLFRWSPRFRRCSCRWLRNDLLAGFLCSGSRYLLGCRLAHRLLARLPEQERRFWHPHNSEILSGQLSAHNLPQVAERELMRSKIDSDGKTRHTWRSRQGTTPGDTLPPGEPMLAWSFNRDGELQQPLITQRDKVASVSTAQRRVNRQDLTPLAKPQHGVDALRAHFPNVQPIPGVTDVDANTP